MKTFIQLCLEGKASPKDADDFVEKWHNSPFSMEINEFLGMTDEEYNLFCKGDKYIPQIIENHKKNYKKKILEKIKNEDEANYPKVARLK